MCTVITLNKPLSHLNGTFRAFKILIYLAILFGMCVRAFIGLLPIYCLVMKFTVTENTTTNIYIQSRKFVPLDRDSRSRSISNNNNVKLLGIWLI